MLPLRHPKALAAEWAALEKIHGKTKTDWARQQAGLIDKGKNLTCVRDFLRLRQYWSQAKLEEAVQRVADMKPDNPRRTIAYIMGILRTKEKSPGK